MTKDDAAASSVIDTTMRLPAIARAVANTPAKPPSVVARDPWLLRERRPERRLPQPPGQRHVDQDIEQHAERGPEDEQHRAADRRTAEQPERARHRHQPHPAVQIARGRRCRGSSSCDAGAQNTPAMPWTVNSTTACQTCNVSVTNSTPQPSEQSMNSSIPN